jgi:hypothetical protein
MFSVQVEHQRQSDAGQTLPPGHVEQETLAVVRVEYFRDIPINKLENKKIWSGPNWEQLNATEFHAHSLNSTSFG